MVTGNPDIKSDPPNSRKPLRRPPPHHIAIPPRPPAYAYNNSPIPSPRDFPPTTPHYRAYKPSGFPVSQPTTPDASYARRPPVPYTPSPYRSPAYPVVPNEEPRPFPLRGAEPRPRVPPPQYRDRHALKPSVSTSNLRSRPPPPPHHDHQIRQGPPPPSPAPARTPYRYHSPELHLEEQLRSSLHSAVTSSSLEPASGTERSSVVTKESSVTDLSPDASDLEGGMSVDDAISMYLDGFSDDPQSSSNEETKDSKSDSAEKTRHRLSEVPETTQHDLYDPKTPTENKADETRTDDQTANETTEVSSSPKVFPPPALPGIVPPPLSDATDIRDRYGFRKGSHHISADQYNTWNQSYSTHMNNRKTKWEELFAEYGLSHTDPVEFPPKAAKVKRFVKKGIPPELRGPAWFWYAGGYVHMHQNPGLYERLVERAFGEPSNDDKEHIERDLHRTFPDNIHFKPDIPPDSDSNSSNDGSSNPKHRSYAAETQVVQALRRVLYAFSLHNPKIGYTQSLNFIAGLLLLFLPEEKAFWMLHIITSTYLPGTHEISLEGANVDLWILMVLLKETMPAAYTKVASSNATTARSKPPAITTTTRLPDITLGLTNWLMSLFIGSLPLETTLRVWDVLFYEGSRTFFRVALAIMKSSEKDILALSDPMEIFQVVQAAPKKLIDANMLINISFSRRFKINQNRVDDLRAARREAVRRDKERVSLLASGGKLRADTDGRPTTGATGHQPVSAWRSLKNHALK